MTVNELTALISLLDDTDESIVNHVQEKLMSLGQAAVPLLEEKWSDFNTSTEVQNKIDLILNKVKIGSFEQNIKEWVFNEDSDLLDGVILVNSIQYPEVDGLKIRDTLESIKHSIWLELNEKLTAFEKVKVLNHFFFEVEKFKPNREDYHSPDNSMINKVLELRKGNPLSLAVLYLHISRRLEMPVYGINTPNHFLLAWVKEPDVTDPFADEDEHPEVLFYINPFANGAILQKEGIDSFLSHNGVNKDKHFLPAM